MNLTTTPAIDILKCLKRKPLNTGNFQKDFENSQKPRLECIGEIRRRGGINFLKELNWGVSENSIYKNRYTATEETLGKRFEFYVYNGSNLYKTFEEWLEYEAPYICENWLPKEIWVEDECFSEHLPKNKLTGWVK